MAKKDYSAEEKLTYFKGRVNDQTLTQLQRNNAKAYVDRHSGDIASTASKPAKQTYTAEERAAWGAGAAWAMGKQGKQIRCKPGNEESFRAGVKAVRKNPSRFDRKK